MKPEDQRIAIAESLGWKKHIDKEHQYSGSHKVVEGWIRQKPGTTGLNTFDFEWRDWNLPDYLNDLNAMHSAKVALLNTPALQDTYACILGALTGGKRIDYGASKVDVTTKILFAEANQEAEALLRAIGKWVD